MTWLSLNLALLTPPGVYIRVEHKKYDIHTCSGGDNMRNCLFFVMAKLLFCGFWMVTS